MPASYWASKTRVVTELGGQGDAVYARDQFGVLWYRFTWDSPNVETSWKLVSY